MLPTRTFAYLLLSCGMDDELLKQLRQVYHGDIIEAFAEGEDQAEDADALWAFGWDINMARIAPVQLTRALDVRPILREQLGDPIVRVERDEDGAYNGSIMYFRPNALPRSLPPNLANDHDDLSRFHAVLRETARLARAMESGLLFIGGWGWHYEMEVPAPQQVLMRQSGMAFVSRHV